MRHLQCCTVDDHKTTESGSRSECHICNVVQWMIIKQQSQGAGECSTCNVVQWMIIKQQSGSRSEYGTCNVVQWMIIKQQSQGAEVNMALAMLYSGSS